MIHFDTTGLITEHVLRYFYIPADGNAYIPFVRKALALSPFWKQLENKSKLLLFLSLNFDIKDNHIIGLKEVPELARKANYQAWASTQENSLEAPIINQVLLQCKQSVFYEFSTSALARYFNITRPTARMIFKQLNFPYVVKRDAFVGFRPEVLGLDRITPKSLRLALKRDYCNKKSDKVAISQLLEQNEDLLEQKGIDSQAKFIKHIKRCGLKVRRYQNQYYIYEIGEHNVTR